MIKKIILTLSLTLAASMPSMAFDASNYAQNSILSKGKWVKIATTDEGIYQLTYSQLAELGFDKPENVQVYGYGGVALTAQANAFKSDFPDDVVPMATLHTDDGRILFFGQGDAYFRSNSASNYKSDFSSYITRVRNPYDTVSYYFLSDSQGRQNIPALSKISASSTYATQMSHIHIDFIENETQNPSDGGVVFHGPSHTSGETVGHTFTIKNFRATDTQQLGSFYYRYALNILSNSFQAASCTTVVPKPLVLNSSSNSSYYSTSNELVAFGNVDGIAKFSVPDDLDENEFTVTFNVNMPKVSMNYCAEDFTVLRYPRANRLDAESPSLVINFAENNNLVGQKVVFEDIQQNDLQVWRLDDYLPKSIPVTFSADDQSASFVLPTRTNAAVAFSPSFSFPAPEIIGDVDNQNLHGLSTPDMVIITIADQYDAALKLAELHRAYQGLDVHVIVHDQIYNEFSSGTRDAMAYRRLCKMFYDRDPLKFRYVLFMGPAFYDNRNAISQKADRLITYQQDNESDCTDKVFNYAADIYFGMLDDAYTHKTMFLNKTQVSVGRVSCTNAGQAMDYVEKVRKYFENPMPASVFQHNVAIGGPENERIHQIYTLNAMEIAKKLNPGMTFSPLLRDAFSSDEQLKKSIGAALNRGAGLLTYIGHGSSTSICGWSIAEATNNKLEHLPFAVLASCNQFCFDHLSNGLIETMIVTEGAGAVAAIGASRSSYIEQSPYIINFVTQAYATAKPGDTYGEIFRNSRTLILDDYAKNKANYSNYEKIFKNLAMYNLAGDPALPARVADYNIDVESTLNTDGNPEIRPFEPMVINGSVVNDGSIAADFSGSVKIEVLDGAYAKKIAASGKNPAINFNYDNDLLAFAFGQVKDGKFSVEMTVPTATYNADSYKVIVSATNDNGLTAIGSTAITLGEFDNEKFQQTQFDAPEIIEFYANDPTFRPGDEISASCTLYAVVNPSSSGLSCMTGNITSRTSISVDGSSQKSNLEGSFKLRPDGFYDLAVPINDLTEGIHSIELCVVNNTGQLDRRSIEVVTNPTTLKPQLVVDDSPARSYATIDISDSFDQCRLFISDAHGKTVFSDTNVSFPFKWDLKDNDGNDLQNGLYKASVLVQSNTSFGSSPIANITILR